MRVRYLVPCALLAGLAPVAHASLIGNPLVPRAEASDQQPYVYNVYFGAPMPSAGTVDSISIFQMDLSALTEFCDSFTVRFLHYTGAGQTYIQYYTSPVFGVFGSVGDVQTYWFGEDVPVQAGDLFVTYGGGIPFTADPYSPDTFFFTGLDFAPANTGLIERVADLHRKQSLFGGSQLYARAGVAGSCAGAGEPGDDDGGGALFDEAAESAGGTRNVE